MAGEAGQVWIKTLIDNANAKKELASLEKDMEKLDKDIAKNKAEKLPLEKQLEDTGVALDKAKAKLQEFADEQARIEGLVGGTVTGTPDQVIEAFAAQKSNAENLKAQQAEVDALQKRWDTTADKVDKYNAKIQASSAILEESKLRAGQLTAKMTGVGAANVKLAKAADRANKSFALFGKRFASVARSALVFTVLTRALSKLRNLIADNIKADEELQSALSGLRAAWLTAFQPVWEVIQPALLALLRILTAVANAITRVFAFFTKRSTADIAKNAKALDKERKALDGVGGAAKEATASLAGFDEINQLNTNENGGGGGVETLNFDVTQGIKDQFGELEVYISGALLALGAILAFSGINIPLGIGLMAVGAIGLATAMSTDWDAMSPKVKKALNRVLIVLGGAMLALGAILAFSGVKLGLGIALMALGAAQLASAAALNWDTIQEKLKGPVGSVVAAVSAGLLAVGAILAFSGVALPLGIALIAAGAVGLATTAYVNWDSIKDKVTPSVDDIGKIASGALLALGLILALTGVAMPLGIALMAAGAVGLVTPQALDWGSILKELKTAWGDIKEWWNQNVAQYFTVTYWNNKFAPIRRAISSLKEELTAIKDAYIQGQTGLGSYYQGKYATPSSYAVVREVPALASGAVIPPNQKFLAMLGDQKSGTNIETPLETMVQAFRAALNEGGTGGAPIHVTLQVDKTKLGTVVIDAINTKTQSAGKTLLLI